MTESTTTHNQDVAQGLREVAEFLEQHPELPDVTWASVLVRSQYVSLSKSPARETLTALAEALGERAVEHGLGDPIVIKGQFSGGVGIEAHANRADLAGVPAPRVIEYEPIIKGERS